MESRTFTVIGANAERTRTHNRQLVLGEVRRAGRIGRARIARASGLSTQAVSNIIADLQGTGLLVEQGRVRNGRGLPAVQYALNPSGGYALGVELRPGAVFAALLDLGGRPLFSQRRALTSADPVTATAAVVALRDVALRECAVPRARLLGAGIVMPGPFGPTGLSERASELPDWAGTDVAEWFGHALDLPCHVENDANAAAMAERISGAARGLDTFAYLYFGTGLGLGMVHQGQLMTGAHGNAGEIGHMPMSCGEGAVALEQMVSRLSVERHLARHGIAVSDSAALATLFTQGCAPLDEWLAAASGPLAQAVAIVENLLDPQTVILGGAMPDAILDHLIATLPLPARSLANRPDRTLPRLMRGASGRMTAVLGAAALVLNSGCTPQFAATG